MRQVGEAPNAAGDILATFLTGQPSAVRRILAEHVDDGTGKCRKCTVGGQRGNLPWPCTTWSAADTVRRETRR